LGVLPYSKNISGGMSLSYGTRDYLSFYIGKRERKDRMPLQKFHYKENFSKISFINNLYVFKSNISGEFANTKNIVTGKEGQSFKSSIVLRYQPTKRLSFGSFVQYYNTYRYSEERSQEVIYGGETTVNFHSQCRLNISFQNSHNIEEYYRDRSLFDVRLSKTFRKKHEVEFRWSDALKQKQIDDHDIYIGLKYTFNFGIPIKKIKNLGSLSGRLIDKGVKSIANVVLNLGGLMQVTDDDGLFMFSDILPGEYFLYLDNASLEFGEISTVKMPMLITIEPDELTDIQIGLTKAGSISGKVLLDFEDEHSEKLAQEDLSQKNVIVELKLDDEIHRDIVNLNDEFQFTGLRPGDWSLNVYHYNLSKNYIIKNSAVMVNVGAEESAVANVYVEKKARRIIFQTNKIVVE